MVDSMTFDRKHLSIAVRQIMLLSDRICFFSAPNYGISHSLPQSGQFGQACVERAVIVSASSLISTSVTANCFGRAATCFTSIFVEILLQKSFIHVERSINVSVASNLNHQE
jgi:hypothetical protein